MEKKGVHDINKLPSDGYIVFPLSMNRLNNEQNADNVYGLIEFFEKKISTVGIDGIFLYTNGLYYNNTESALEVRKRTNGQMLSHKNAVLNKVIKNKKFIPQSMHFLPWDYIILNSPNYQEFFQILLKLKDKDKKFRRLLIEGLKEREENEANINFLLEEIVVTHLIRQKMIEFPRTLVKQDKFRLIVYPGSYLKADLYQWKNKILPQNETANNKINPFYASQYNSAEKVLYNFDELSL